MMNRQKRNILNDLFNEWKQGKGIFYYLDQLEIPEAEPQIPWKNVIDAILLDWEYHGNRSGTKIVSPLLSRIVTETGLTDEQKEQIAALLWYKFRKQWTALWATTTATYNPIENYSMTEHRTHGDQQDGTNGIDTDTTNRIRGFNSSTDLDSDSSEGHSDGEQHLTTNGYEDITRSGNIGVTTSQQMLQSERDLWDWNFFDQVFKDIDSILIIPEFGCSSDEIYFTPGGYVLPVATAAVLGGVKAKAKTIETGEIAVDADGKLWYVPGGDAPVQSVNGQTGAVVLDNEDVGAPSQSAFNGLSSDVQGNTEDIGDLMEAVPFKFGVDGDGNYGYYKAGADTVTPFSSGVSDLNRVLTDVYVASSSDTSASIRPSSGSSVVLMPVPDYDISAVHTIKIRLRTKSGRAFKSQEVFLEYLPYSSNGTGGRTALARGGITTRDRTLSKQTLTTSQYYVNALIYIGRYDDDNSYVPYSDMDLTLTIS